MPCWEPDALLELPCLHLVSIKWERGRQKGRQRERQRNHLFIGRVQNICMLTKQAAHASHTITSAVLRPSQALHTRKAVHSTRKFVRVCVCVCICAWWCTKCTSRSAYACRRFGTLFVNGSEIEHTHAHSTKRSHHLPGACCWLAVRSARVCPLPLSSLSCCRVGSSSSSSSSSSSTASSRWVLFMIPLHR